MNELLLYFPHLSTALDIAQRSRRVDSGFKLCAGCRGTGLPCAIIRPWPVSNGCVFGAAPLRLVAFFIADRSHCFQAVLTDLQLAQRRKERGINSPLAILHLISETHY